MDVTSQNSVNCRITNEDRSNYSHILLERASSLGNDACEINDEKRSDVNGSVIDNLPHETLIFSDSLESLTSPAHTTQNSNGSVYTEKEINFNNIKKRWSIDTNESYYNIQFTRKPKLKINREFNSCENLKSIYSSKMLHRSRPDLIKGIATRSKEGFPTTSSQSCTDVSTLSQSNSENSLNSSGSVDANSCENKAVSKKNDFKEVTSAIKNDTNNETSMESAKSDSLQPFTKKKDKRSEIVEAVTTRLYTKKKPDPKLEALRIQEKEHYNDDGELEELKLCKRARMKLCDLSRKLALTRKIKKTKDSDTQTDFSNKTIRVKEKSIITEERGILKLENSATNTSSDENFVDKGDSSLVMNQVFIPQSIPYVVECGRGVRIEVPKARSKNDSSSQTNLDNKSFKDTNTSPIQFDTEDGFSEDSLDLEETPKASLNYILSTSKSMASSEKFQSNDLNNQNKSNKSSFHLPKVDTRKSSDDHFRILFNESDVQSKCAEINKLKEIQVTLYETLSPEVFGNSFGLSVSTQSLSPQSEKEENFSSENSTASVDSTGIGTSSETSSEDFVFYENPNEKLGHRARAASDRELYTITENSEQSDLSEAYSPVQSQNFLVNLLDLEEAIHLKHMNISSPKAELKSAQSSEKLKDSLPLHNKFDKKLEKEIDEAFLQKKEFSEQFDQTNKLNFTTTTPSKIEPKPQSLTVPNLGFLPAYNSIPKSSEVPKTNNSIMSNCQKFKPQVSIINDDKEKIKNPRGKKMNWGSLQSNTSTQSLNMNISNNQKHYQFTIDTNFGEISKRDQSTETMFTSDDSITLVFMGPNKAKTSVLMEVIKRTLNKGIEHENGHRKSRSRGVQCSQKMIRSVSVDTALLALSRIVKQPRTDIGRANSLDFIAQEEVQNLIDLGRLTQSNARNKQLRYSASTLTTRDQGTETKNLKEKGNECLKKELSYKIKQTKIIERHDKTSQTQFREVKKEKFFSSCSSEEFENEDSSEEDKIPTNSPPQNIDSASQTRRVRFSKPETWSLGELCEMLDHKKESIQSTNTVPRLLKEAKMFLKNLSYFSNNNDISTNEVIKQLEQVQRQASEEKPKELKASLKKNCKKPEPLIKNDEENKQIPVKFSFSKFKNDSTLNLTWPRRRSAKGKTPKINRNSASPKSLRSPLSSLSNSTYSNGFVDFPKKHYSSSRMGSESTTWNASNLSTTFSNSYMGEIQSRPSSSRSLYSNGYKSPKDVFWCPPRILSPKVAPPQQNFDSLSDLETELEESCRRLKLATEQDRLRQEAWENKIAKSNNLDCSWAYWSSTDQSDEDVLQQKQKERITKEPIKRRKVSKCVRGCTCGSASRRCCMCPRSKSFSSTFELDTFGPGNNHCHQFCMFCRQKDSELYNSTPSLNSECFLGRCRLNYYGHCPCSPVKLLHVTSSPRAYMQHLLTLRRRIVDATKSNILQVKKKG